jgi:hypothetical protein
VQHVAGQPLQRQVGHHRSDIHRFAGKADVERFSHEASSAVCADQVSGPDGFLSVGCGDAGAHAQGVLRDTDQFAAELHALSKFRQAFAHHGFGQILRKHKRTGVRFSGSGLPALNHFEVPESAVAVLSSERIEPTPCKNPV